MEVRLANDFSDDDLREAWGDLLSQNVVAGAQLTREWLSSWWEVFGDRKKLSLVTVTEGGRIIGLAPLTIAKVIDKAGFALRKLTFAGDGLTDYHDLLIADEKREETLRVLLDFVVNGDERWDAIHFRNVRGDSPNLPILRDVLEDISSTFIERVNIRSPYISIDGNWTDYYGALGKNMRSDIRRRSNRLAKMGKVEFVRLHEVDDVTDTLDTIKSIHVKCRQAQGGGKLVYRCQTIQICVLNLETFWRSEVAGPCFAQAQRQGHRLLPWFCVWEQSLFLEHGVRP